ncbi:hypothetical protein H6G10_06865 [Anabaena cylindrica FACHB-170]|uniref:Uncharacterized protein n=2 Tax=Nostocaceae TaxID=1162 RepID=A0A1Z4KU29_ANAVA|nr:MULTISPECIES: hypothetical protein [Anabaena]BAB73408.1 asr1451 [Nostoc sp. PCC 7120 = FACHB-418]BAY72427.1 hypothetical protein NIES23_52520 [Trichormus variabilis NIES-23]HBW32877.1 hypothetical protein [Nostoc sp. UBA8866]MBD2170812.1 hypothetical protein [Anabaena cylindrica FACHB-318]MBD2282936.1 hypothetical protein [Anabaena cylindrica FACHB-170]
MIPEGTVVVEANVRLTVKILKDGDQVLNVWYCNSSYFVAIRQNNGEVCVYSVTLDEEKIPRLSKTPPLKVTFGEGEVEAIISSEDGDIKVTTD